MSALIPLFASIEEQRENTFTLRLHADHAVFQGHFPGAPVVPGACQLQIVEELSRKALERVKNIKYLNTIDPLLHPLVCVDLTWGENLSLNATFRWEDKIFSKMSLIMKPLA